MQAVPTEESTRAALSTTGGSTQGIASGAIHKSWPGHSAHCPTGANVCLSSYNQASHQNTKNKLRQ